MEDVGKNLPNVDSLEGLLRLLVEQSDWKDQGNCLDQDPNVFFPEKGASTKEAKSVCASCIVRQECVEFALDNNIKDGVWGGMTGRERRRLRRSRNLGAKSVAAFEDEAQSA